MKKYKPLFFLILVLVISRSQITSSSSIFAATNSFISTGNTWTYFKGTVEPPAGWNSLGFDDSGWLSGPTGIGYGDGDDATVLNDMQGNYLSVYMRRAFTVTNPNSLTQLLLQVDYDDGFIAYLNGVEVARRNLGSSGTPTYNATATNSHEAGTPETIDITPFLNNLIAGANVLAIQVHNVTLGSSDLSMIPELHWVDNQPTINLIRYPYLQMLNQNHATIVWTTTEPGPGEVRYSTDLSYGNVITATSTYKSVTASPPYDNYYEHVAVLSNLTTNTVYNYTLFTQGTELATDTQFSFQTHPDSTSCTFNFAFLGDTGQNVQLARDVRGQALARGFDFAVNVGDLAYENGKYNELEGNYFTLYKNILWNKMMWTAVGNHEYRTNSGTPYLDVFHLPEQALRPIDNEQYYAFDYGNAHFVILDTNTPLNQISDAGLDDMADWLEADLSNNTNFWTIVAMHHPWYVSDNRSHPSKILTELIPRFETYNVDIVLTGHDHLYERTFPLKNDTLSTIAEGGVIYITNGEGGGRNTSYNFTNPAPDWSASRSDNAASYTHIYVDNGVMSLITIDNNGNVLDPTGSNNPVTIIDRSNEPGATCNSNINGTVYEDTDGNGVFNTGDIPLQNVQIDLSNGQSTTSNTGGLYQFTNLVPGNYTITETDSSGYFSSGDVDGPNDNSISVNLQSNQTITNRNFFDFRPAILTGTVYEDTDSNGGFSADDMPMSGVEISLSNGQFTTTQATGLYQFTNLPPGHYVITETDPVSYTSVVDVQGTNDNIISVTLVSGATIDSLNFLDRHIQNNEAAGNSIYLPVIVKQN